MLASAVTFTIMTTLIKYLGDGYSASLQAFYRQAAGLVVMLPIMLRNPVGIFRTSRPGILMYRSVTGTVGMILAFYSYQKLPLADANALSFTRTLWLVPLAAFVLKESVGPRRISATVIGFFGAILMVQPAAQGELGWPAAAGLASAFIVATTITGMKVMTRDHSTTTLIAWSAVLGFVFTIPPALFDWRWPTLLDLTLLAGMGIFGLLTQAFYIKGMSEGDAAVMAPLDYTRLVFAIVLGYLLFQDVPNAMTLVGAAIVILSTLYITVRESRLGLRKPPPERVE
jgi:drug/metabolite transporter (DMT)-like permease